MDQPAGRSGPSGPVGRRLVVSAGLLAAGAAGGLAAGSAGGLAAGSAPAVPQQGARPGPIAVDIARIGLAPVEAFRGTGDDDDAAFGAALAYAGAQTYPPPVVFANRRYRLTRRVRPFSGVHLLSFGLGDEFHREEAVRVPAGGLFAFDRAVQGITLENLSVVATDHLLEPIAGDDSQGSWRDLRILGGGYTGGTTLLAGTFLRLDL